MESQFSKMESKQMVTIEDLPIEIIKLIFSFLPFDDMVNVQKVCQLWESVTSGTLLWKHAPLNMRGRRSDIFASVPYLHTVTGLVLRSDDMLNSLVEHVLDLRKIDCQFSSYSYPNSYSPSLELMQIFFKKFVNLEGFVLHISDFSSAEAVRMLRSCPKLNTLDFHDSYCKRFTYVYKAIGDGFPALRKLYISKYSGLNKRLSYILRKKINQLTELLFTPSCSVLHPDVLGLILNSTILEKLEFSCNWPVTSLDFSNMVSLKCLSVNLVECQPYPKYCSVIPLHGIEFPKSLESITIRMSKNLETFGGVVSKVIESSPNLKVLDVGSKIVDTDINEQLEQISNLQNLHTVSFGVCSALSAIGLEYILNCTGLRKLKFKSNILFMDKTYECLKSCKYLGDVDLSCCILNYKKLISTLFEMEYLKNITFRDCIQKAESGEYLRFAHDEIIIMKQECRKKNCNVTVKYSA